MNIYSKTYLVTIEIINWIKMTKESVTNQEKILIFARQTAFMYYKITFTFITFIQILFRINFENKITHLKSNRLDFRSNIFARRLNMAKSFIAFAIKIRESSSPFLTNSLKNIRRNRKLWTSSINNSRITWIFSRFLHSFVAISHALALKSPSSKPIWEIFESLKSLWASNNLSWIVTTK